MMQPRFDGVLDPKPATDDAWAAWLVFADWLDEHGDPSAAWIRQAHRYHGVSIGHLPSEEQRVFRETFERIRRSQPEAAERLEGLEVPKGVTLTWRMGFVSGVRIYAPAIEAGLGVLDALHERWAGQILGRIEVAMDALSVEHLDALLAGRWVSKLTDLALLGTAIGPEGAQRLAAAPLGALRMLALGPAARQSRSDNELDAVPTSSRGNVIGDEGARALAATPWLGQLRSLDLATNEMGPRGFAAMRERLRGLVALRLGSNRLGNEGARLVGGSELRALRRLDLSVNGIGPAGVRALAQSEALGGLRTLELGTLPHDAPSWALNRIGNDGLAALAAASWPALHELYLDEVGIGGAGVRALARSTGLRGLGRLDLGGNPAIDASSLLDLFRSEAFDDLYGLRLAGVPSVAELWHLSPSEFGSIRVRPSILDVCDTIWFFNGLGDRPEHGLFSLMGPPTYLSAKSLVR